VASSPGGLRPAVVVFGQGDRMNRGQDNRMDGMGEFGQDNRMDRMAQIARALRFA